MTVPVVTKPTWIKVATFDPGTQMSTMFNDIKTKITEVETGVTNEYNERRQVLDKATAWLTDVKQAGQGPTQAMHELNASINNYAKFSNNVLTKSDTLMQNSSTTNSFLGQVLTATGVLVTAISFIPGLGSEAKNEAQALGDAFNLSIKNESVNLEAALQAIPPGPDQPKQSQDLFSQFATYVQNALSSFTNGLLGLPSVTSAPETAQTQVSTVSSSFQSTIEPVSNDIGKAVSQGVEALKAYRPIKLINHPPVSGGLTKVADSIIHALGKEGALS